MAQSEDFLAPSDEYQSETQDTPDTSVDTSTPVNTSSTVEQEGGMTDATKQGIFEVAGAGAGIATGVAKTLLDRKQMAEQKAEAQQIAGEERTYDLNRKKKLNALRSREMEVNENRFALNKATEEWNLKFSRMNRELERQLKASENKVNAYSNVMSAMRNQQARNAILDMFSGGKRA